MEIPVPPHPHGQPLLHSASLCCDQTPRLSFRPDPKAQLQQRRPLTVLRVHQLLLPHLDPRDSPLPESCDADGRPSAQLSRARYPRTPSSPLRRCVLPARLAGVVLVGLSGTFLVVTVNSSRGGGGEDVDWWNAHLPGCTRH